MTDEWTYTPASAMTLRDYPCGVSARDIVELKAELIYRTDDRKPTGMVRPAGDQAMILVGNPAELDVIWLRWKDGTEATWSDAILDDFTIVGKLAKP